MAASGHTGIIVDAAAVASDDESDSSDSAPDELTGDSPAVTAVIREPKVVGIGLDAGDAILRPPHVKDTVIVNKSKLTGPAETEAVLTGGWLVAPTLLSDIVVVNGRKFVQLQKFSPQLSAFFSGKHPRDGPLKKVQVFAQMKRRVEKHCSMLREIAESAVAAAHGGNIGETCPGKQYGGSTVKKMALRKRNAAVGKRTHHRSKVSCMLPSYDVVDMSFGTTPWSPTMLLRGGHLNVFMEVTAGNLQTLFNIVQAQIADPDALTDTVRMSPKKCKKAEGPCPCPN